MIEKSSVPAERIDYVGDRVEADIKSAKAVGMKTCLVYSESEITDFSFTSFRQILTMNECLIS